MFKFAKSVVLKEKYLRQASLFSIVRKNEFSLLSSNNRSSNSIFGFEKKKPVNNLIYKPLKSLNYSTNDDTSQLTIIKRLLLEFENNHLVYLTNKTNLFDKINKYYLPKHISVYFVDHSIASTINRTRHDTFNESTFLLNTLNTFIIQVNDQHLNEVGQILIRADKKASDENDNDCNLNILEAVDHLNENAKLIAVLNNNNRAIGSEGADFKYKIMARKPDLIVSDKFVLRLNKILNQFEMTEFAGDTSDETQLSESVKSLKLKPIINKNNVKKMAQQCI